MNIQRFLNLTPFSQCVSTTTNSTTGKRLEASSTSSTTSPSSTIKLVRRQSSPEDPVDTLHDPSSPSFSPTRKSDFKMISVIGKGSFGKVVLVSKKDTGHLYAMKILSKEHCVRRRQVRHTKTERDVLAMVSHPYIVNLHYAFQTSDKLYFVMDYCPGGDMFHHLAKQRRFSERVSCVYSAEIVLALEYLHSFGIIYRDLKPENLLLDANGHIKLADFGLAKDNVHEATHGATSACGTPAYLSPEVVNKQTHGTAVDWWGLGMVTFEMLTGLPPWYSPDHKKILRQIKGSDARTLRYPKATSKEARGYVLALLEKDPTQRLGSGGVEAIKGHAFYQLNRVDWSALQEGNVQAPFDPWAGKKRPVASEQDSKQAYAFVDPALKKLAPDESPADGKGFAGTGSLFNGFTFEPAAGLDGESNAM
jgi:serine/threonine protein kinase